jgi:hypothetical protein
LLGHVLHWQTCHDLVEFEVKLTHLLLLISWEIEDEILNDNGLIYIVFVSSILWKWTLSIVVVNIAPGEVGSLRFRKTCWLELQLTSMQVTNVRHIHSIYELILIDTSIRSSRSVNDVLLLQVLHKVFLAFTDLIVAKEVPSCVMRLLY